MLDLESSIISSIYYSMSKICEIQATPMTDKIQNHMFSFGHNRIIFNQVARDIRCKR